MRQVRARVGIVFQSFNLFPHLTALGNAMEAPMTVKKMTRPRPRRSRATISNGWAVGQGASLSGAALRRPAAARGDCARAGDGARRRALRRADLRARSAARSRGCHPAPFPRRSAQDAGRGVARHGLRAGHLRSGDLLRRGPGGRVGHGERGVRQPDSPRHGRSWRPSRSGAEEPSDEAARSNDQHASLVGGRSVSRRLCRSADHVGTIGARARQDSGRLRIGTDATYPPFASAKAASLPASTSISDAPSPANSASNQSSSMPASTASFRRSRTAASTS